FISRDFYKTLARIRGHFLLSAAPNTLAIASTGGGSSAAGGRLRPTPRPAIAGGAAGSSGEPRRLLQRLAAAAPAGKPSEPEIREESWLELLAVMGLTPASAARMRDGVVRQEAAAACRALDALAESNQRLRAFLKELQEGKSDALAQKYSELHRSFGG